MTEPIVLINLGIKEGKLDAYRLLQRDVTKRLEAEKPRTLVFLAYLSQDGTELTIVHAFADSDAMDLHFEGSDERSRTAFELVEPRGWEIYGRPSHAVLEVMRNLAASWGVGLTYQPEFVAGFLRPTAS